MKINNFFIKLFLSFFISIFLVSLIFFTAADQYIKKQNRQIFVKQLSLNKDTVMASVLPILKNNDMNQLANAVNSIAKTMQRRITITDNNGTVIADSEKNILQMQNHSNRSEIKNAMSGITYHEIRYSSTLKQEMLYIASPITDNSEIIAVLRLSMPLSSINILSRDMQKNIFFVILMGCFLALLLSYFFTAKISGKIIKLKTAAGKMAEGKFGTKIFTESKDELDKLAESFNFMSEKLEQLFLQTKQQSDRLDKIISSTDDTIILIDKSGKILLHNNAFNKHFKNINPDNKYYWEIFRDTGVESAIKDLADKKNSIVTKEIKENTDYFLFTASLVQSSDDIVITFHNITSMKQMELLKREFVANASHELKTPLTAINGFLETIETETDLSAIIHYVGIIKKHSLRLSRIVTDLLSLSEMENKKNFELTPVRLENIITNTLSLFSGKIDSDKLSLKFIKQDGQDYIINANEFYIEQMLLNLIENAVRYTEKGEITVKLDKQDRKVILSVSDTGIGIAQEHLSRIFERFYVVDKARSRKTGGTGLGLSIVKYIVNNHNASIEVSSRQHFGTTFTIKF